MESIGMASSPQRKMSLDGILNGTWTFWRISGYYGKYSKAHYFANWPDNITLCGREAWPEIGSELIPSDSMRRCKTCISCAYR